MRYEAKHPSGLNIAVMKINNRTDIKPLYYHEDAVASAPWGFWSQ
jgi:hypothetical protein